MHLHGGKTLHAVITATVGTGEKARCFVK